MNDLILNDIDTIQTLHDYLVRENLSDIPLLELSERNTQLSKRKTVECVPLSIYTIPKYMLIDVEPFLMEEGKEALLVKQQNVEFKFVLSSKRDGKGIVLNNNGWNGIDLSDYIKQADMTAYPHIIKVLSLLKSNSALYISDLYIYNRLADDFLNLQKTQDVKTFEKCLRRVEFASVLFLYGLKNLFIVDNEIKPFEEVVSENQERDQSIDYYEWTLDNTNDVGAMPNEYFVGKANGINCMNIQHLDEQKLIAWLQTMLLSL